MLAGEETATTAPELADADTEAVPVEVVGDPQDWQKRVSSARAVPHDGQKLISFSWKMFGQWPRREKFAL